MTREEAIKEFEFNLERQDLYDDIFLDACRLAIEALQERPKGRWESSGEGYKWCYICSECGWADGFPFEDRHNFCPNCGADMKGEQE